MSSGADIKRNIQEMVAGMSPPILPTTTLTAAITPGDTTAQVAPLLDAQGRSRIVPGASFYVYDTTDERRLKITDVIPGAQPTDPVTLHFDLRRSIGGAAFQYAHAQGATAYTSIFQFSPWSLGPMLELGDPAITLTARQKHSNATMQRAGGFPLWIIELRYFRQFSKPFDVAIDDDEWAEEQERLVLAEPEAIEAMLFENQELAALHPSAAIQLGADGQVNDLIVSEWDWQPREGDIIDFTATMRISVLGLPE